jgi:hypothetical protein
LRGGHRLRWRYGQRSHAVHGPVGMQGLGLDRLWSGTLTNCFSRLFLGIAGLGSRTVGL